MVEVLSEQTTEVHIIRGSHLADPSLIERVLDEIGIGRKDLYFDELTPSTWTTPSRIPALTPYVERLRRFLHERETRAVPMGHTRLVSTKVPLTFYAGAFAPEEAYFLDHFVVPLVEDRKPSKAVINLGHTHASGIERELKENGYEPTLHTLQDPVPEVAFCEAARDYAASRRDTYLVPDFVEDVYAALLEQLDDPNLSPKKIRELLDQGDAEFKVAFRDAVQLVFSDETIYERHTREPERGIGSGLRRVYDAAKERCDELRKDKPFVFRVTPV